MSNPILSHVQQRIKDSGFEIYGTTRLRTPLTMAAYDQWLQESLHGDMDYLARHRDQKAAPGSLSKSKRSFESALVISCPYYPEVKGELPFQNSRIALYAKGEDYHYWLKEQLEQLAKALESDHPDHFFEAFVDTGPVLERDLARQAGLGWIGKNTCLLNRKQGSLFFLGEILTSLTFNDEVSQSTDHCGACTKCLEACPTNAIIEPRKMDARRCISYLTIESREIPPEPLRPLMQDWLFGCDICQTVCPWNEKVFGRQEMQDQTKGRLQEGLSSDLEFILTSSNKKLARMIRNSPLSRAGGRGLKRNAIIVAANLGLYELRAQIKDCGESYPALRDLSLWALNQLAKSAD